MGQTWLLQRGAGPQALTMAETAATVHTAEGFFLSLQFSPPTLPSCPRAWSPEDSTVAVGHRSQHRGSQEHTTSPLPNDFPAVRRDQNPKVTGDCCPHLHSDLILPAPTPIFPCHKHLACSRLASQTHSEHRWLLRSTRGWKGSLCSVPSIPSCSVLPQSKSLFT